MDTFIDPGKTVLVTGAGGQLGKALQKSAAQYPAYHFLFETKENFPIDNFAVVKKYFSRHRIDYCINCAAYTAVDTAETDSEKAFSINGDAVGNLAKVCKDHQALLIHISTDYVFDGTATQPYKEEDAIAPVNMYGASKLKGEELALNSNQLSVIIRTSWLYSSENKNFVKTMLRLMSERESVNVVSDQYGCPTYAPDLAAVIMKIIEKENEAPGSDYGIFNYCNTGITTWYDFAEAIKEIVKSECKIIPVPTTSFPTPAKRPGYSVLDTSKIQQLLGVTIPFWKDSLKKMFNEI
ncbi:MAG: dTDP-4-dehydrorhamnose reductase [Chitinophagaceae bacterium]|nr:dTDP-4-dehydrorhamnose reductase [Chitinophagaceae bacterium]